MKFDRLDEDNFIFYAMKHYDNPCCTGVEEFYEDINKLRYLKRLMRRYKNKCEMKCRLVLNHIITLYNVFGCPAATRMLVFKQDSDSLSQLKTYLIFLDKIKEDDNIEGISFSDIPIDQELHAELRKI